MFGTKLVEECNRQKRNKRSKKSRNTMLKTNRLLSMPYGSLLNFHEIFPTTFVANNDVWLEICFRYGDNLLTLAHRNSNKNISFIGAETHESAIGIICKRMKEGIDNNMCWTDYEIFSHSKKKL